MSVILDAIKENLRHIKIIFEPTEGSFTKDTKKTGDAKELSVKQFVESFFPQSFEIKKGLIYSIDDNSLMDRKGKIFTPEYNEIKNYIQNSNSFKFTENTEKFLEDLSKGKISIE